MFSATKNIEINLLLFGLPLNFVWEMLQMPFFVFPGNMSLSASSLFCLQASAGDVVILLLMYWILVLGTRSRGWIYHLNASRIAGFLALGIILTVIIEAVSTRVLQRWAYADMMPTLPVLGTGMAPVLQWLIIPILVIWAVQRRQSLH